LKDIVSEETLLAQIPFVENVQDELERLKQEREENKELNPFFSTGLSYQTSAMANSTEQEEEKVEE
jgi:adenine-specific DNA methylase